MKNIKRILQWILISGIGLFVLCYGWKVYTAIAYYNDELKIIEEAYIQDKALDINDKQAIDKKIQNQQHKKSSYFFIKAYLALGEGNIKQAKQLLNEAEKLVTWNTPRFVRVYTYQFLAKLAIYEGDFQTSLEYIDKAYEQIPVWKYNKYYATVWDALSLLTILPEGSKVSSQYLEEVLEKEYLFNTETKAYFYRKNSFVNLLGQDYSKSIEYSAKLLNLKPIPNTQYYLAKSMIDLATIAKNLGAYQIAIDILEKISLDISVPDKKAEVEVERLLNLAENKIIIKEYQDAKQALKNIKNHEYYLPPWKQREVQNIKYLRFAETYIAEDDIKSAKQYFNRVNLTPKEVNRKMSYTGVLVDYIRILARIYQEENKLDEAEALYRLILEYEFLGKDYEDSQCVYEQLKVISLLRGNKEAATRKTLLIKQLETKRENYLMNNWYKYFYQKYYYQNITQNNKNIRIMHLIYSVVLGICLMIIGRIILSPQLKNRKLKKEIQTYISDNQYFVAYQPIVNPKNNKIMAVEALLRLCVNGQVIYPSVFIPQIQKVDMMVPVTLWVLKQILKDYPQLKEMNNLSETFYISMNVSLKEILDGNFIEKIINLAGEENEQRQHICLEITENIGITNIELIQKNINQLIQAGFKIAIDDFGVDYSNISMLDQINFHTLKLDRHFIEHIQESLVVESLIKVINELSIQIPMNVVVEGVEEAWQKEKIRQLSSEKIYIQGYYYSKPKALEELLTLKLQQDT